METFSYITFYILSVVVVLGKLSSNVKFYIFDLVILLTFSYYCTQFKMIRIQHNTMRSRNINMRQIVAVALVVFIMETQNVAGKFLKYSI